MRHILVVDDLDLWRNLARYILSEAGYEVTEAESGEKAVRVARVSSPDLVLVEYEMTRMGGVETARLLRAIPSLESVPILLLTAHDLPGGCNDSPAPPINGYINKRDAATELLKCVVSHLG